MKKIFLPFVLSCLSLMIFIPILVSAQQGLVPCDGTSCTIDQLVGMVGSIYSWIVTNIAAPLGTLAILIGAILMMTSAGDPNRMSMGKKVFWSAVIGLVLALGTAAIIKFMLQAVGFQGQGL